MSAIVYTLDLNCSSKATAAGARSGVSVQVAMSEAALLKKARRRGAGGVGPEYRRNEARRVGSQAARLGIAAEGDCRLRTARAIRKKLQAAQEAGCAHILTQGQFYGSLDSLLGQLASGE